MIDSLLASLPKIENRDIGTRLGVEIARFAILTLHRPSNVDGPKVFGAIIEVLRSYRVNCGSYGPCTRALRKTWKPYGCYPNWPRLQA